MTQDSHHPHIGRSALIAADPDVAVHNVGMERARLRSLLLNAQGEAVPTFLSLLDDPETDVPSDADQHSNATANLLTIYRRRAEHVRAIGLPTIGFEETVDRLEATSHERLTVGLGSGQGGHPWCVAFLTEDLSEVIAVLAVLGPATQR